MLLPQEFYQKVSEELHETKKSVSKKINTLTVVRLAFFIVMGLAIYFSFGTNILFGSFIFVMVTGFLFLVTLSEKAKLAYEKAEKELALVQAELASLRSKKTNFDCGEEYLDPSHAYAADLDLFAPTGIFSFYNRTTSKLGKNFLAQTLLYGSNKPDEVAEDVRFLRGKIRWTLAYRVSASIASREKGFHQQLNVFNRFSFVNPKWLKLCSILIPFVAFSTLVLNLTGIIGISLTSYLFIACVIPTAFILKETNLWYHTVSNYDTKFKIIMEQLTLLKELNYEKFQGKFNIREQQELVAEFLKIVSRFEIRLNMLLSIPINLFFAWDIRQRLALEKWAKQRIELEQIEKLLAEVEVLISAATVLYHYQDEVTFSTFESGSTTILLENLRHPLISEDNCIPNNFELAFPQNFMILTGPNMAGKSTYLRSVGLSIVFANAGFPVFAKKAQLPYLVLFSSMRTSDDLSSNSSYFYAELKRLQVMKETLLKEKEVFILLDEILKGTNSKDKEEGSRRFLLKMNQMGAKGIIATHDLSLCEISRENESFRNFYFDSAIEKEELSFDYKIKPGICQNMNASFLLKKMELID